MHLLARKAGWGRLKAAQNGQVFLADFDLFTQPSPSTLVDGIELLAGLFHPELFAIPSHLQAKTIHYIMLSALTGLCHEKRKNM